MRADLLALTTDDLVLLANRGLARRAQAEADDPALTCDIAEASDGSVSIRWSDAVTCVLPGNKPASAGRCSCPATTICRHVLRSILAYQRSASQASAAPPAGPWNPGSIDDATLDQYVPKAMLAWARRAYATGQVVELVRALKPSATIHTLGCTVRFLVPGNVQYTHCECAESAPCRHVPLAIWAFRQLAPGQASGLVETHTTSMPVPSGLLGELAATLHELILLGIAGVPQPLVDKLRLLEQRFRNAGLIWPADALAELTHEYSAYANHDARFDPSRVCRALGELAIRSDAIQAATGVVPQLFIRGSSSDTETAIGAARLIGLGCAAQFRRGGVDLVAYLYDSDSGSLAAVLREHTDPPLDSGKPPASMRQLASQPIIKAVSLASLATSQVLIKGGRRLPNGRLLPGRAPLTVHPQTFAWETLRPPVFAEDIGELQARIAAQPPPALRPRRLTDGVYGCAVSAYDAVRFDSAEQALQARLHDPQSGTMTLWFPYHNRNQAGIESLLQALRNPAGELRFVAGHVSLQASGLRIVPTALVFQNSSTRTAVWPWLGGNAGTDSDSQNQTASPAPAMDPLSLFWHEIETALSELLLTGLQRPDPQAARRWRELTRQGAALGHTRLLAPITALADAFEQRQRQTGWQPEPTISDVLQLARNVQLVQSGLLGIAR